MGGGNGPLLVAAVFAALAVAASAFVVDNGIPQGNAFVAGVKGDTVELHNEIRDTVGWWFWWAFRVRGAEGRTLKFRFRPDPLTGRHEFVSTRGAAVSSDLGATWRYTDGETHRDSKGFAYAFGEDEREVWFAMCLPHGLREWRALVARHAADAAHFRTGVFCASRKGREVPCARLGRLDGKARFRLITTARHHAAENVASYVQEGVIDAILADTEAGRWFRENVEALAVPFMDLDGVVDGDQGKNRFPHDPARDYDNWTYPTTAALRDFIRKDWHGKFDVVIDFHCPHYNNPLMHQMFTRIGRNTARQRRFAQLVYENRRGMLYHPRNDVAWNTPWSNDSFFGAGRPLQIWAADEFDARLVTLYEIPFASTAESVKGPFEPVTAAAARAFGGGVAEALMKYLLEPDPAEKEPGPRRVGKFATGAERQSPAGELQLEGVRFDRDVRGRSFPFFDGARFSERGRRKVGGREIAFARFERGGRPVFVFRHPNLTTYADMDVDLSSVLEARDDYVLVDLASGNAFALDGVGRIPVGTVPGLVVPRAQVEGYLVK